MGVCIEPPDCVIGLNQFDQYIFRTQPEGHRSGAGDLDLIVYSLRKFATLAAAGNPTILMPLFAPESEIVVINEAGRELRDVREIFLSRLAGERFLGYLSSQREQDGRRVRTHESAGIDREVRVRLEARLSRAAAGDPGCRTDGRPAPSRCR